MVLSRSLFAALCLASLGALSGCDNSTPAASDVVAQGGVPGSVAVDQTIQGVVPNRGNGIDTASVSFVADSGTQYTAVVGFTQIGMRSTIVAPANALALPSHSMGGSGYNQVDSVVFVCTKSGSYKVLVIGMYGSAFSLKLLAQPVLAMGPSVPDAYEPDNGMAAAKVLAADGKFQERTLHGNRSTNDEDWIAIPCDSGWWYTIQLRQGDPVVYPRLFDAVGRQFEPIDGSDSVAGAKVSLLRFGANGTGLYYLKISSFNASVYAVALVRGGPYCPGSSPDLFETDSTMGLAKAIATDSTVQHRSIHGVGSVAQDVDWIAIHADSGKSYNVHLRGESSNLKATIFTSDTIEIANPLTSAYGGMRENTLHFLAAKTSTFYLRVSSWYPCAYDLAVVAGKNLSLEWMVDRFEPDGMPAGAKFLPTDSTFQLHTLQMGSFRDIDWIAIKSDSGTTIRVAFWRPTEWTHLEVYESDGTTKVVTTDSLDRAGKTSILSFPAPRTTTYYLKVFDINPVVYKVAAWTTKGIPLSSVNDRYEPDNFIATAKTIASDSLWQDRNLHLATPNTLDPDVVGFLADSGKTYYLQISDTSRTLKTEVLSADSLPVASLDTLHAGLRALAIPISRSGRYFVRCTSTKYGGLSYRIALVASMGLGWGTEPGEPDHGPSMALRMVGDSGMLKRFITAMDTDWIQIKFQPGRTYELQVTNGSLYEMDVTLLDGKGQSYTNSPHLDCTAPYATYHEVSVEDSIFVQVGPTHAGSSWLMPYWVSLTSKAIPLDPMEPDSSLSTASSLASDSVPVLRGLGPNDHDWMRIQVDSGRKFIATFQQLGITDQPTFYDLWTRDSVKVQAQDVASDFHTRTLSYTPLYMGAMYLHVSGRYNPTLPYSVVVVNEPLPITAP